MHDFEAGDCSEVAKPDDVMDTIASDRLKYAGLQREAIREGRGQIGSTMNMGLHARFSSHPQRF